MSLRLPTALAVPTLAVLWWAGPASAHEEINPKSFPTGTPTFFMLSVANEETSALTKVALAAPDGVDFGETTRDPAGWTAERTDTTLSWSGGSLAPGHFEQWGYEIEGADQPGELTYKVTLSYEGGASDTVDVVVHATPGATSPSTGPPDSVAAAADGGGDSDSASGVAIALAVSALAVAVAALVAARRRSKAPAADAPAEATAGGEDW